MWRNLVLVGFICIAALQAPVLFEKAIDAREKSRAQSTSSPGKQTALATPRRASGGHTDRKTNRTALAGRKVQIRAGYGGHYYTEVRMNNRPVKVMVDTGATMVALNETTARKIGIHLKASDFKYKVNTANGVTKMASAMIREIRIGNIRVQNVRAGISRDGALSTTLLGMSFLNQLKRFEVSGQTLLLEQ